MHDPRISFLSPAPVGLTCTQEYFKKCLEPRRSWGSKHVPASFTFHYTNGISETKYCLKILQCIMMDIFRNTILSNLLKI